jgi:hypothetical protein
MSSCGLINVGKPSLDIEEEEEEVIIVRVL